MQDFDSRQHVLQACRDHDVKFIRLWFTDILGMLKSVAITVEELEHALDDGVTFDGASIEGFARTDEADMIIRPDAQTFQLLPWRPRERAVARMFCDIHGPDGEPFEGDPRWILKRAVERAAAAGFTCYVSPEIEYFYFRDSHSVEPLDSGGYFDLQAYLRDLEKLPTQIYWGRAELTAQDYPRSTLKLLLYTLSFERAWMLV